MLLLVNETNADPVVWYTTEEVAVKDVWPELNLWNAVLLQIIKESESIRSNLKRTSKIISDDKKSKEAREKAFSSYINFQSKKSVLKSYTRTLDFEMLCDFANQRVSRIRKKILDVLDDQDSVSSNQTKRSFTRKPK